MLDEESKEKHTKNVEQIERDFKAGKIDFETRDKLKEQSKAYSRVKCQVGQDRDQRSKYLGHFSSEYVMVYYDEKYLKPLRNYALPQGNIYDRSVVAWSPPRNVARYAWTDDYSNLVKIMR